MSKVDMSVVSAASKSILSAGWKVLGPPVPKEEPLKSFDEGLKWLGIGITVFGYTMYDVYQASDAFNGVLQATNTARIEACFQQNKVDATQPCKSLTLGDGRTFDISFEKAEQGCTAIIAKPTTFKLTDIVNLNGGNVERLRCHKGAVFKSEFTNRFGTHFEYTSTYGSDPYKPTVITEVKHLDARP